MSSIRGKIIVGYLALTVGVGGFVLFASADLRYLERRVHEGVAISGFQETEQEMRRHEKNYFLYRERSEAAGDLAAARAAAAELSLTLSTPALTAVADPAELLALRRTLGHYRTLVDTPAPPEAALRAVGHELSRLSERLAQRERSVLIETMRQSRHALLWAIGVLILLALAGGQVLYRAVGRPLRQLEEQLEPLAAGRFTRFSKVSDDREIVSFTQALNHMLEELELRRRQVLQAEKLASLGTLASGVAHELNNPLGNISGAAQILLEEIASLPAPVQDDLRGWLVQIDDETERARHIVDTLLDYGRRSDGGGEPVPLVDTVAKALLLLKTRLPEEDSVVLAIPDAVHLRADPRRLQQVFINLIQNALAAGARRVTISARAAVAGDWPPATAGVVLGDPAIHLPATVVEVADDGPGIAAEHLKQLFDPFFTTRDPGEGTGLGLFIVGEIVLDQGGGIAVSSTPGAGARFTLYLPCERPA